MPPQTQQADQPPSLRRKRDIAEQLAFVIARVMLLVLRWDLGYRLLSPSGLFFTSLFMFCFAWMFSDVPRSQDLAFFAIVVFILGIIQRTKRWREFERKICQHSGYVGTSPFDRCKLLPRCFFRHRRNARFLDPILCLIIGWIFSSCSPLLTLVFVMGGICLHATESALFSKDLEKRFNAIDTLVSAEVQGDQIEQFTAPPQSTDQSHQKSQSIPTGLGADIEDRIKEKASAKKANEARDKNNNQPTKLMKTLTPTEAYENGLRPLAITSEKIAFSHEYTPDHLVTIATKTTVLARAVAVMILLGFLLIPFASRIYAFVPILVLHVVAMRTAAQLARSMGRSPAVWAVLLGLPPISFYATIYLTHQAALILRRHGISCSDLGVSRREMQRFGSPNAHSPTETWKSPHVF